MSAAIPSASIIFSARPLGRLRDRYLVTIDADMPNTNEDSADREPQTGATRFEWAHQAVSALLMASGRLVAERRKAASHRRCLSPATRSWPHA